ncbi:hypothetical protein ACIPY3_08910 [Paenarthrobacter sp. NPDC089714]|uniref:hypothetical protein n=1 Tax=Paenarthrobacter sp. NPDC089714 TaxID=3364377 RepID=UPI00380FBAE1
MTRRAVLNSVAGAVLAATVSACGLLEFPDEVDASDIVGGWTSKPKKGHATVLKLSADGMFEWSGVPEGTFSDWPSSEKLDWERLETYSGEWSIEKDITSKKFTDVRLRADKSQHVSIFPLSVSKRGSERSLTYWLGDPDSADSFKFHLTSRTFG